MSRATRPRRSAHRVAALACTALLAAACAPAGDGGPAPGDMGGGTAMDEGMAGDGMDDMGAMGMGGDAGISVVGEAEVSALPPQPVGWVGYRIGDASGEDGTHTWGPAFLYAADGEASVVVDGTERTLGPGEAVFVAEGVEHTAPGGLWAFLLTDPEAGPAPGLGEATRELSSGPLEGLPDAPAQLRFVVVDLPADGGQTGVHTHPGPEFVFVRQGEIEYETGLQDTTVLTAGDESALPAGTAVQKRNVAGAPARFWSWFVVDPDEPFSSEAVFDRE